VAQFKSNSPTASLYTPLLTHSRNWLAYFNKNVKKYFKELLPTNRAIGFGYLASQHLASEKNSSDDGTESKKALELPESVCMSIVKLSCS
jgi:hypothetical protein